MHGGYDEVCIYRSAHGCDGSVRGAARNDRGYRSGSEGGSSVHLVGTAPGPFRIPAAFETPEAVFEPPSEYQALETVLCRFVVPDKAGIFPVSVDLFDESLGMNPS